MPNKMPKCLIVSLLSSYLVAIYMVDYWKGIYLLLEMVVFQFHFSFISGKVICIVCVP